MRTLDDVLNEQLRDDEFKKEYEDLKGWYELQKTLIDARIKSNLTQKDLANKLGIKQSSLARFESKLQNPKIETLIRYAKAVGLKNINISLT